MTYPSRCEINVAGREEDCGRQIAYTPCGGPAHWRVESDSVLVCESHAMEYLRDGCAGVAAIEDGEPVALDDEGEIVRAA